MLDARVFRHGTRGRGQLWQARRTQRVVALGVGLVLAHLAAEAGLGGASGRCYHI